MIIPNQMRILILLVLIYLIWAMFFHKHDKSLTLNIILEYFLIAVLVLILLLGVWF